VSSIKKLPYEAILEKLGFSTMEKRRIRGDLIKTFKTVNGMEYAAMNQFFESSDTGYNLRGHDKQTCNKTQGSFSSPLKKSSPPIICSLNIKHVDQ